MTWYGMTWYNMLVDAIIAVMVSDVTEKEMK